MTKYLIETPDEIIELLSEGVPICNRLFGLAIPDLVESCVANAINSFSMVHSADEIFRAMLFSLDGKDIKYDFDSIAAINRTFINGQTSFENITHYIEDLVDLTDIDLMSQVSEIINIEKEDLRVTFANGAGVWAKINHGWWELAASHALEQLGRPIQFFRNAQYYEESGCFDLIARTIPLYKSNIGAKDKINCISQNMTLSISFNAGSHWNDQISAPLPTFMRGALLGAPAFLQAYLGEGMPIVVADGAAAKKLAYQNVLGDFCNQVRVWSDAVIFITPEHLATINLDKYEGEVYNLIVPSTMIHELWPSVLVYCAGAFKKIFRCHNRVSIFVQAAVISAPICAIARDIANQQPELTIRAFDFGQVLDLAEPSGHRTHKWARDLEDYPEYAQAHVGGFVLL